MYVREFEELAVRIVAKMSDPELFKEYQVVKSVFEVDEVETSLLIEFLDAIDKCVLTECAERYCKMLKEKEDSKGKVVKMELVGVNG